MRLGWQRMVTIILLTLVAAVYCIRQYLRSRETHSTFTEPMRFVVTNDVIYFHGANGLFAETNAEWARGLRDVSGEIAFVTINEIWANGRRVKWRIEGVTKPTVRE